MVSSAISIGSKGSEPPIDFGRQPVNRFVEKIDLRKICSTRNAWWGRNCPCSARRSSGNFLRSAARQIGEHRRVRRPLPPAPSASRARSRP